MTETRVTRSKAKLFNLEDHNANNNSVANKNKQNDSGKIEVDSKSNKMDSAPFKLKNTFNDFNNVRNISETTNYTVSRRDTNHENESSESKKCEQVLESVNKMAISGKTDMKVIRSFMEHVSGGDVVGLMAKLVTSTELDKIVDIVGATEVKQETFNDNIEVSDYQNNLETVAEVISDDESNDTGTSNNIELNERGNDLPVISEVVGSHIEDSNDDDVEITRVIGDGGSGTNSSQPSTSMPAPINASNPSSSHSTSRPPEVTGLSSYSEYQQLIQRYLAPVSLGSSMDTAQMEAQMLQFLQGNQLSDVAQLESQMVQFLQQSGYKGYQEFLARSDLSTLASLLPTTSSSSSMTTRSSLSRDVTNLSRATLTPMGVSLTPVTSSCQTQPPPAHRRLEPAHMTPTGVSLTKVATNSLAKGTSQDRQLYADPRSDLPPAARNDETATRPPVIVSVESLSRSASVVANSLAKSSARRASVESLSRSSNVVAQSLGKSSARRTKTAGAVLSKVSQKEPKQNKDRGKGSTRGEAATPFQKKSSEDDFIYEEPDTEKINKRNDKNRVKATRHRRLNNVIEDSESETTMQSASEESEDEDYVYEEAENDNRKRSPRAGSSKKRKNVERDESSESNDNGRKFLRPRFKSTSEEEESYSSDDMTEKAKRSRAFKQFKMKRNSAQKSSEKGKARISARAVDSETDDGDGEKEENSKKRVKRNLYNSPKKKKAKAKVANYIDSSDSESDRDLDGFVVDNIESESEDDSESDEADDDFVVNDDDDDEIPDVNNEFRKMMESLKRRSQKFQNLNEDYEIGSKCKQLGGYDDSDDEPAENKYPPKLLEDLREVRNEASKDKENDGLEDAEDLSNDDVIKEWEMYEVDQSDNLDGECVCGQTGLRWMYFMRNKKIQNWEFYTRIVGSECINWFHRANPKSCMALLSRVAKDGCILYYRKKLDSGQLLMTVGGNMLPGFLAENQQEHKEEYRLPISITKLKCGTNRVDIKVKPPPASQGKGLEKVRDTRGKILEVDQRYHVYLKPSIKPSKPPKCKKHWRAPSKCRCNLKKDPAKVDFIILKIENLKDKEQQASRKPPTVKSFIK